MRRRTKFALAIATAILLLAAPLLGGWFVESSFEPPDMPSDADGDGLRDERESQYGTSRWLVDTDGDGIDDGDEVKYWQGRALAGAPPGWIAPFHGLVTDEGARALLNPNRDLDLDGVPNAGDPDSDGDGLKDGAELDLGTDPADPDSDGDGVGDREDAAPLASNDADGDGLPDDWESFHGVDDPQADDDGDGLANILEFAEGTSPVLSFGLEEGGSFDLTDLYYGAPVDSLGDLFAYFREDDGSLDLGRPVFQVGPTTPARYWRLMDLKTWSASGWSGLQGEHTIEYLDRLPTGVDELANTVFEVYLAGRWVGPVPAPLYTLAFTGASVGGRMSLDPDGTLVVTQGHISSYSMTTVQMQRISVPYGNASDWGGEYAWLPPTETELPPELAGWRDVAPWERVSAARSWLWSEVRYSNSVNYWPLNAPLDLVVEGHGTALDFASALTVLSRMMDVPARLVVGFAPGIIVGGHRVVRVGDLHAWTEVYIGTHWVPVEATTVRDTGGGMGLASAGEDVSVIGSGVWWCDDPELLKYPQPWGASGGSLTSGCGGIKLPDGTVDTDGDGVPDAQDADDDGDGLPDELEREEGTNPIDPDTDHDGLNDASELLNGTSPVNGDSDGDGIADGIEVIELGTDPLDRDTDGAGSCDIQEFEYGTDPLDPEDDYLALDWDCDGLTDAEEAAMGTRPASWDSDVDGIPDGRELLLGTDPDDADSDDDGLDDGEELNLGTDPLDSDTDDDGLDDGSELEYVPDLRYVPSDPTVADTDGDGLIDSAERLLGTRPDRVDHDGDGLIDSKEVAHDLDPLVEDSDGDGVDDLEELERREMEDRVEYVRDGAVPIFLAATILSAAMAFRYRPFDRRIVPDVVESLSELERWLASLGDRPDDEVRKAIYKAYERLCSILADYGFLGRKAWTVREFETAVHDALPWVPDELLDTLTTLFEEARYSDHELDSGYIDRARECLAGIRGALEDVVGMSPEKATAKA